MTREMNYGSAAGFKTGSCPTNPPMTEVNITFKTVRMIVLRHGNTGRGTTFLTYLDGV